MHSFFLVLLLLGGCGGEAPSAPDTDSESAPVGVFTRRTQAGHYTVELRFDPPAPKVGQLFAIDAVVTERDGQPMEYGELRLNARMPQHGHGMETDPEDLPGTCVDDVCSHPGGRYRTEGFKLHMPGAWTITIDVLGPAGPDSTSLVYEIGG